MILNIEQIKRKIKNQEIKITPLPKPIQYQPASLDLTLSDEFLQGIDDEIDIKHNTPRYEFMKANRLILPPNTFILASTREKIELPNNLISRVEGRSSIGRLGVTVHITAGFIDPGFEGNITLEIANLSNSNIILYEGMRICQLVFEEIEMVDKGYGYCNNKYQGQKGVTGSMVYYDEMGEF